VKARSGSPVSGEIHYFASFIDRPPFADKSADERRLRNWIHEKTLSGDINRRAEHPHHRRGPTGC